MFAELKYIPEAWSNAWRSRSFRNQLILSLLFCVGVGAHQFHFLRLWQDRSGIQINDVILNLFPPADFSFPIFALEYSSILLVFIFALAAPERLVKGLQMFALIFLARTVSVYLIPLEQPKDMIPLNDPMASLLLHTPDVFVTKDLFFSGHISAIALLMLIATNKYIRGYAFACTIIVGVLIMWQHVHYSIDVLFAPLVSYVAYKFILYIHRETKYGLELAEAS
ncbi:MAG: phosphatase PAP2-related protein [Bacteroidota bacterium]